MQNIPQIPNMYKIITKIQYEYAHRLIHHLGKCRNLHGHSGEAVLEFTAENLNHNGFVMDFGDIKTPLKAWINANWDHAFLANAQDPLLPYVQSEGLKCFIFPHEPTAEVMAHYLYQHVNQSGLLPTGVRLLSVSIQETCSGIGYYAPNLITP